MPDTNELAELRAEVERLRTELEASDAAMQQSIDVLAARSSAHQCSYCGVIFTMRESCTDHVRGCPKRPEAKLMAEVARLKAALYEPRLCCERHAEAVCARVPGHELPHRGYMADGRRMSWWAADATQGTAPPRPSTAETVREIVAWLDSYADGQVSKSHDDAIGSANRAEHRIAAEVLRRTARDVARIWGGETAAEPLLPAEWDSLDADQRAAFRAGRCAWKKNEHGREWMCSRPYGHKGEGVRMCDFSIAVPFASSAPAPQARPHEWEDPNPNSNYRFCTVCETEYDVEAESVEACPGPAQAREDEPARGEPDEPTADEVRELLQRDRYNTDPLNRAAPELARALLRRMERDADVEALVEAYGKNTKAREPELLAARFPRKDGEG